MQILRIKGIASGRAIDIPGQVPYNREISNDRGGGTTVEFDMPRLHPDMMERYEIENHRPSRASVVEFGLSPAMLGAVNRRLEETGRGVIAVDTDEAGYADRLNRQGGLYTLVIRGYEGEEAVDREQVIQCLLEANDDPDSLPNQGVEIVIVDDTDRARRAAAEYIRRCPSPLRLYSLGPMAGSEPLLADSLAERSTPREAAQLCGRMNYLDEMIYIAEPYCEIYRGEDCARARRRRSQIFDTGLFLMAAPGWLNGLSTLRECMDSQRLRRFVGEAFTREVLPALDLGDREYVIRCFERYSNPLNENRILTSAGNLLSRFVDGPLERMATLAAEDFEPPRGLSFSLSATIMLYAGARLNPATGQYEVARGRQREVLRDDPARLQIFSTLAHDMPPETLAYAALADRELWSGRDLREIEGLEARVALDISMIQRQPGFMPE